MSRLIIGLTGGIASGKSEVGRQFVALGVPLLDADQVSREVVTPGSPALVEVVASFGPDALLPDGSLDRRRMRERIFNDAAAKQQLEAILHPHMAARMRAWSQAQTAPYCILSIAILIETGMRRLVQRVLVVDAPVETQLDRLIRRDNISEELARSMIAAQTSRELRLAAADDVITNAGSPDELKQQVAALHQHYLALAHG